MRRENDFYLLLPDLSEQNKLTVLSRIRRNLQKAGPDRVTNGTMNNRHRRNKDEYLDHK